MLSDDGRWAARALANGDVLAHSLVSHLRRVSLAAAAAAASGAVASGSLPSVAEEGRPWSAGGGEGR
jgi:hypothetical protein